MICSILSNHFSEVCQLSLSPALWSSDKYFNQCWVFSASNSCWLIWSVISNLSCQNLALHSLRVQFRSFENSFHPTKQFLFFKIAFLSSVEQRNSNFIWQSFNLWKMDVAAAPSRWDYPSCTWAVQLIIPLLIRTHCE